MNINGRTQVKTLKIQFLEDFELYDGKIFADGHATLASIRKKEKLNDAYVSNSSLDDVEQWHEGGLVFNATDDTLDNISDEMSDSADSSDSFESGNDYDS